MALIELVDYNEVYTSGDVAAEKKTTRRRGSKAKKSTDAPAPKVSPVVVAEEAEVVETPLADVETAEETPEIESTEETPASDSEEKKEE